jgi:hypothetical protein
MTYNEYGQVLDAGVNLMSDYVQVRTKASPHSKTAFGRWKKTLMTQSR